jgi:hypothetical protein
LCVPISTFLYRDEKTKRFRWNVYSCARDQAEKLCAADELQQPNNQGDPMPRGLPPEKRESALTQGQLSQGLTSCLNNVPISGMGSMKCH